MELEQRPYLDTYYIEEGEGQTILLLHGLFGALSNFKEVTQYFSKKYKVIIPYLPLYSNPLTDTSVSGLVEFIVKFIQEKKLENIVIVGNSLGGHVGILYALKCMSNVKALILTASSGLFENSLGNSYPKKDYIYIKRKTEETFYDPAVATKELIDEVYKIVNDREKAIRVLFLARSAIRYNLRSELPKLTIPTQLIWGKHDKITPVFVGEEFHKLLPNSELEIIEKAGHAPMMEQPVEFIAYMEKFLEKVLK
ncbi:MAG: alpha/beta hydrolase [Bacteroidetes bacterium]|nr:alpha/beta hydrolase [Bacteroidota bacterium]